MAPYISYIKLGSIATVVGASTFLVSFGDKLDDNKVDSFKVTDLKVDGDKELLKRIYEGGSYKEGTIKHNEGGWVKDLYGQLNSETKFVINEDKLDKGEEYNKGFVNFENKVGGLGYFIEKHSSDSLANNSIIQRPFKDLRVNGGEITVPFVVRKGVIKKDKEGDSEKVTGSIGGVCLISGFTESGAPLSFIIGMVKFSTVSVRGGIKDFKLSSLDNLVKDYEDSCEKYVNEGKEKSQEIISLPIKWETDNAGSSGGLKWKTGWKGRRHTRKFKKDGVISLGAWAKERDRAMVHYESFDSSSQSWKNVIVPVVMGIGCIEDSKYNTGIKEQKIEKNDWDVSVFGGAGSHGHSIDGIKIKMKKDTLKGQSLKKWNAQLNLTFNLKPEKKQS